MEALEGKVAEIEHRRRSLLLSGTDAELKANMEELAAANLEAERAQAAVDEMQRQIVEAEARAATGAAEASSAEAREVKARLDRLGDELTDMATKMARMLGEAEKAIADIRARNKKFVAAGRPDLQTKAPDIAVWKRNLKGYVG